mgnify:CR=1 FL=1
MTKEQIYAEQMRDLGIYDKAFEPEIHTLAILEREHQRTMKEWKATAEDGRAPSAADKLYTVIQQQRRDILAHREALGLTPKAFKRLRPMDSGAAAGAGRRCEPAVGGIAGPAHGGRAWRRMSAS